MRKLCSWALLTVFLGVILVSAVGCGLNTADQARLNKLAEDMRKYEDIARDIRLKVDSGDMTLTEGKALVADVEKDIERIREEAKYIANQGYDWKDILMGLGQMALTFFGVNVYRSRSHPLTKTIK